jgi:hypothetical protein
MELTMVMARTYLKAGKTRKSAVLADRKFDLEQLNVMRPWEDALDDCLLRYHEVLLHD